MDADSRNQRSSFTLIFYIGDIRYEYFVEMDGMRIYKEELYFYPNSRRALFFERKWIEEKGNSTISFGPLLKLTATQKLFVESNCLPNMSVLATYMNANVERNALFDNLWRLSGKNDPSHARQPDGFGTVCKRCGTAGQRE